jgi:hypothetical protein
MEGAARKNLDRGGWRAGRGILRLILINGAV